MAKPSTVKFDVAKYQIQGGTRQLIVKIEDTEEEFELTVKQLSWSKRNQLISKCLEWQQGGTTNFNGDLYVRECLKEMIIEAPWGRTTEAFLVSIDERLGGALEGIVPKAFGSGEESLSAETVKKE
jgi:hypothetical protein